MVDISNWRRPGGKFVKQSPIPIGALLLLTLSLIFWLTRRITLANWTLLVIIFLGGLPLLWETIQQFLHKEVSVDLIAIMSGIDLAARNGIIAKSGAAIEQLGIVDSAIFDKTGTLTLGKPQVTGIVLRLPNTTERPSNTTERPSKAMESPNTTIGTIPPKR
jgi:P-type E1-E2 ATPase